MWRKSRTVTLARLETENAQLRYRITELERLLGLFEDQTENSTLRHRVERSSVVPGRRSRARSPLLAALGGLGQLAAAGVFIVNMCTRVRMPGGVAPPQPLR